MRVVVVGGGIAGLAAAVRLRERADATGTQLETIIIDRAGRVGGKLHTTAMTGRPVEAGAETFLMREDGAESAVAGLARRLGLELLHPAPVPAALADDEGLRPIPAGTLLGVPADLSTLDGLAAPGSSDGDGGAPLLGPDEDIAVGALVRARYGDAVVDRLVDPMLGGVYAGHADKLSLAATMPGLLRAARERHTLAEAVAAALAAAPRPAGTPVFASVRGGLSRLVDAAVAAARPRLRLGLPVRALARTGTGWRLTVGSTRDWTAEDADAVILAVPARPAARLLEAEVPDAATALGALDYASVALVTLALPAGTALPDLSGFLVPAVRGYAVKAATFFGRKWPHLGGADAPVLVRASLGRYCEVGVLQRPDAELAALARADLDALLDTRLPTPVAVAVSRWGGGLPQYAVGHVRRVAEARAALPATLALAGAATDGVGIAACVRSGFAAADRLLDHHLRE